VEILNIEKTVTSSDIGIEDGGMAKILELSVPHENDINTFFVRIHGYSEDKNHKTGKIRGLLCNNCNICIGF